MPKTSPANSSASVGTSGSRTFPSGSWIVSESEIGEWGSWAFTTGWIRPRAGASMAAERLSSIPSQGSPQRSRGRTTGSSGLTSNFRSKREEGEEKRAPRLERSPGFLGDSWDSLEMGRELPRSEDHVRWEGRFRIWENGRGPTVVSADSDALLPRPPVVAVEPSSASPPRRRSRRARRCCDSAARAPLAVVEPRHRLHRRHVPDPVPIAGPGEGDPAPTGGTRKRAAPAFGSMGDLGHREEPKRARVRSRRSRRTGPIVDNPPSRH